jgi:hypothetical protein
MAKYIVYSKVSQNDVVFWRAQNVNPIEYFNSLEEAVSSRKDIALKYLHELTDSGYKLEFIDNIYVIMKSVTDILPGYFYNSTVVKQVPIISFHIGKCDKREIQNDINKNVITIKSNGTSIEVVNSNQVTLIAELTKYLSGGIRLKRINTQ